MYEPRRASATAVDVVEPAADQDAFHVGPRRAVPSKLSGVRTRVVPAALSVALLVGGSALALNLKASEATAGVPAPLRSDAASRSETRTATDLAATDLASASATPTPTATATAETASVTVGSWDDVIGEVKGTRYAQSELTVRAQASKSADKISTLEGGDKVKVTDKTDGSYQQVVVGKKVGYVLADELGTEKPASNVYTGSTTYTGKTVLGLKPQAMVVYNAVTAKWSFSSIGGYRASSLSNHQYGGAIDFMTGSDSAKGWEVANYLAANAKAFNIDHIIFEQKIWTPANPTWRHMADRGSATANHMDHVHVSVNL